MNKSQPKKPTGEIKGRILEMGNGPAFLSPAQTFKLPESKNEAEDVVMQKFVQFSLEHKNWIFPYIKEAIHYPTDHGPDFEATNSLGEREFFELTELAPLKGKYSEAEHNILVSNLIEFIQTKIDNKIKTYTAKKDFRPISLIIYVSHYAFLPGPHETKCINDSLFKLNNDVFTSIYLEIFAHDGTPQIFKLWPSNTLYFTKSQFAGHLKRPMLRADPESAVIQSDNSRGDYIDVVIRQFYPKGTDLPKFKKGAILNNEYDPAPLALTPLIRKKES